MQSIQDPVNTLARESYFMETTQQTVAIVHRSLHRDRPGRYPGAAPTRLGRRGHLPHDKQLEGPQAFAGSPPGGWRCRQKGKPLSKCWKQLKHFGRIDLLVNNFGIYLPKAFPGYTEEDYNLVMNTNVASFFYMTQQVIPQMKKQSLGYVVNISAVFVGGSALMAVLSKSTMPAVSQASAQDYAANDVRFNTVSPAVINTPMHAKADHAALAKLHPLGRIGEVSDIVDAVVYLQNATFLMGKNIRVDGGEHAGP